MQDGSGSSVLPHKRLLNLAGKAVRKDGLSIIDHARRRTMHSFNARWRAPGIKRGDSPLLTSEIDFQHQLALSWINCKSTYDPEVAVADASVGRTEDGMIECIFRFQAQLQSNSFMRTR
jgi:hypothetical protein